VLKIGALSATPRSCMSSRTRRAANIKSIFSAPARPTRPGYCHSSMRHWTSQGCRLRP
jgi:hypothetical protein